MVICILSPYFCRTNYLEAQLVNFVLLNKILTDYGKPLVNLTREYGI